MKKENSVFSQHKLIKNNINEPFKHDYTGQLEQFSKNLTFFLEKKSKNTPFVVSINAPWGMGKTTFLNMWGQQLINENKLVIKYDAWGQDLHENPLISILTTINDQLKLFTKRKKLIALIKKVNLNLALSLMPSLIKFIISVGGEYFGASESFKKLCEDIGEKVDNKEVEKLKHNCENFKESISRLLEKEIDNHKERNKNIIEFKNAMRKLIEHRKGQTLFFLIDELDRCKPLFSIAVIEIIKHFFDIEKICFVIISNNDALFKTFKKIYGYDFDSANYFERFIDRSISLPLPNYSKFIDYYLGPILPGILFREEHIFHSLLSKNESNFYLSRLILKSLLEFYNFNLREIQKFLDELSDYLIISKFMEKDGFPKIYLPAVIYLLILKNKEVEKYKAIIKYKGIINKESIDFPISNSEKNKLYWIINLFIQGHEEENLIETVNNLTKYSNKLSVEFNSIQKPMETQKFEELREESTYFNNFSKEINILYEVKIENFSLNLQKIKIGNYQDYLKKSMEIIYFLGNFNYNSSQEIAEVQS